MKLKEYLAQFKDIDPELEVYIQEEDGLYQACNSSLFKSNFNIRYISGNLSEYIFYTDSKTEDFDTKVLVLI